MLRKDHQRQRPAISVNLSAEKVMVMNRNWFYRIPFFYLGPIKAVADFYEAQRVPVTKYWSTQTVITLKRGLAPSLGTMEDGPFEPTAEAVLKL